MQAIDDALLRTMYGWGEAVPFVWTVAREITLYGGARFLVPLSIFAGVLLYVLGHRRRAIAFWAVTLLGRVFVELSKLSVDRARPSMFAHQADVFSQSFPSGHAANSTIVYLALALIAAPILTKKRWPIGAAIVFALLIGLTRPILGVHWPSDVLAGWAGGLAWTLSGAWLAGRWVAGQPPSS